MKDQQERPDPLAGLKKYLAEWKSWPVEKQEEEADMLHNNKYDYYPRFRQLAWVGTDEELIAYIRREYNDYDEEGFTVNNAPADDVLLEHARGSFYNMERMSDYDFHETLMGMYMLEGFEKDKLLIHKFTTPEPPTKTPKYFPVPELDKRVNRFIKVEDLKACPNCGADKYSPSFNRVVGLPERHCAKCWWHVLSDKNIMADDTYEYYELLTPILFSGTKEDCERFAANKWNQTK